MCVQRLKVESGSCLEARQVSTNSLCHVARPDTRRHLRKRNSLAPHPHSVILMTIIDPIELLTLHLSSPTCCTGSQIVWYARQRPRKHICVPKKLLHPWASGRRCNELHSPPPQVKLCNLIAHKLQQYILDFSMWYFWLRSSLTKLNWKWFLCCKLFCSS